MSSGRRLVKAKTTDYVLFIPILLYIIPILSTDQSPYDRHKDDTLKKDDRHIESEGCWFEGQFAHI